jgi:NitT/TauT family transport system substrate-binding protein
MTNGDALVVGATGGKSVIVLINDYSNGNDMIVAKPGIKSLKDLVGKKVGLEVGFVDHLLLLNGLEKAGIKESDVTLVNTKTNETPQVLASGDVDAIGAWQPSSGQALKLVPGSSAIYTSADEPGLIYDVLAVNPASLSSRRADWLKVVKVWGKVVAYINDPKTTDDALKILSGRVGLTPEEYKPFLGGTKLLTLAEGAKVYEKGDGFKSIYGSTQIVDDFNIKYDVYKEKQDVSSYIDPSLTIEAAK